MAPNTSITRIAHHDSGESVSLMVHESLRLVKLPQLLHLRQVWMCCWSFKDFNWNILLVFKFRYWNRKIFDVRKYNLTKIRIFNKRTETPNADWKFVISSCSLRRTGNFLFRELNTKNYFHLICSSIVVVEIPSLPTLKETVSIY